MHQAPFADEWAAGKHASVAVDCGIGREQLPVIWPLRGRDVKRDRGLGVVPSPVGLRKELKDVFVRDQRTEPGHPHVHAISCADGGRSDPFAAGE